MRALLLLLMILIALPAAEPVGDAPYLAANAAQWRCWTPGVIRPEQGTIEVVVVSDRPMREFGNDWHFVFSAVPAKVLGNGANTLIGLFVPPLPDTGLVAIMRSGTRTYKVVAPDVEFTPGLPTVLAVSWGTALTLMRDGVVLGTTPMADVPDEALWPDHLTVGRFAPFHPQVVRISTSARPVTSLLTATATPTIDDAVSLLADGGLQQLHLNRTTWHAGGVVALAKPVWRAEKQTYRQGEIPVLPIVAANRTTQPLSVTVDVVATPTCGGEPLHVSDRIVVSADTPAQVYEVPFAALAAPDLYTYDWRISGTGMPTLQGSAALAVYPRSATPAAGAMADFYAIHHKAAWNAETFAKLGVTTTRAWAESDVFLWYNIEPVAGGFQWENSDAYVAECRANGMAVLGVLGYPSRWAASEPTAYAPKDAKTDYAFRPARWQPRDLDAWARYVRATVTRYRGKVRSWEIYNEVNFHPPAMPATFSGTTEDYLALQRIAYREAKIADPACQVLCSGFSDGADRDMPLAALGLGLAEHCDIFNVHGYSGAALVAPWLAGWRQQRGDAPAWMTEQMCFQVEDRALRSYLTVETALQFALAGYQRFFNMGVREVFFDRATFSPTDAQWVVGVMQDELRPCTGEHAAVPLAGSEQLSLHHQFKRSDGSWLTVVGSEYGAFTLEFTGDTTRIRDLHGRPLRTIDHDGRRQLDVPELAWLVSDAPLRLQRAVLSGDRPLVGNGGFEEVDGDIGVGGLSAGRPRGYVLRDRTYDPAGAVRLTTRAAHGTYALEVTSSGQGRVYAFQNLSVPTAGTYVLSGDFRVEPGGANPTPYLFVFDQDSGKVTQATLDTGDGTFHHLQLTITLSERNRKPLAVGWGILSGSGIVTVDDVAFTLKPPEFDHARFMAIDLTSVANQGASDDTAGDGQGGFADLGAPDLRGLPHGEQVLGGLSFRLPEAAAGTRPTLVMTGGGIRPELSPEVVIPLGFPAAGLVFLHTALQVQAKPGEELGRYLVTYADGSQVVIPLTNQRTIADWFQPLAGDQVPVALTLQVPDHIPRQLYSLNWSNLRPEVALRNVTLRSQGNAILALVALSTRIR